MSSYRRDSDFSPSSLKQAFRCCLFAIALCPMTTRADDAARPLSRLVPAQGLTFYFEYEGLRAHAAAWKATAAREILCETPAGAALAETARTTMHTLLKKSSEKSLTARDVLALEDHIVQQGFAGAFYEKDQKSHLVVVLNDFKRDETQGRFDRLLRFVLDPGQDRPTARTTRVRGRELHEYQKKDQNPFAPGVFTETGAAWWFEGDALVLVTGPKVFGGDLSFRPNDDARAFSSVHRETVEAVLDAIEGKAASASTHPGVTAARAEGRDLGGFEPNGLLVAESNWDPINWERDEGQMNERDLMRVMGLAQGGRVVGRWGFRGKALLADLRFESSEPRKGMVGMLDPAGFQTGRLPPIPAFAGAFAVGLLHKPLDSKSIATLQSAITDAYRPFVEAAVRVLEDRRNRQAVEGVLDQLGPMYCLFISPWRKKEGIETLLIGSRDVEALAKSLDAAAARLNAYFREQETGKVDAPKPGDPSPALVLERLPAPERGYRLISPEARVPWLEGGVQPTFLLGKSHMVVAANPEIARRAVAAEGPGGKQWRRTAETAKQLANLPEKLAFLAVGNPRDSSWPEMIAALKKTPTGFLDVFLGADLEEPTPGAQPSDFLELLGVRKPAGPAPRVQRPPTIKVEDLRSRLFPSILAATIDDRGVRLITLEALPLACLGVDLGHANPGLSRALNMTIKFAPGE